MKTKSLMVLALIALFIGMGTSAYAVTITPVISSDAAGTIPITTIAPGQRFFVNIQVSEATGIVGAAVTLVYNKTLFNVIGKDGVVADPASGAAEINRDTYSGDGDGSTKPGVILESDAFVNMTDSGGTNTMTLRTGNIDVANGKVMLSGAFIDKATGTATDSLTGPKNLFRIRFRAISTATVGASGQFSLSLTTPTVGGWNGTDTVWPLIGAAAKSSSTAFANLTSPTPNNSVTSCSTYAFCNLAYAFGTDVTLTIQGQAGNVRGLNQAPTMTDVMQLLYLYKHLRNTPGYESYTSDKYFGNLDFNHDGNINMSDVMYLLYYYKYLRSTPGYDNYKTAE